MHYGGAGNAMAHLNQGAAILLGERALSVIRLYTQRNSLTTTTAGT